MSASRHAQGLNTAIRSSALRISAPTDEAQLDRQPSAILVVDDEPAARAAVCRLLRLAGLPVITAADGLQALEILEDEAWSVGLIISDYAMPAMNGAELLRAVRLRWPDLVRVLLTGNADLPTAAAAVNEGQVARLFLKPWDPPAFQQAVLHLVEEHQLVRENRRLQALVSRGARGLPDATLHPTGYVSSDAVGGSPVRVKPEQRLTPRELEVLELLASGRSNPQIGRELCLSAATVKIHVAHILSKLKVRDRTEAAVRAFNLGLLTATA